MRKFLRYMTAGAMAASLGLVAMGTGAATASTAATLKPAASGEGTPSEQSCFDSPSNSNCDGAPVAEFGTCWTGSYVVHPDTGGEFFYFDDYLFETDLRYSPGCKSNFAVTTVTATGIEPYDFSNKIRRAAGADGPYLMEHGGWYKAWPWSTGAIVISPLVYSPDDTAQACFSNDSNDQVGCTSWF